jgi:hypothetical protein
MSETLTKTIIDCSAKTVEVVPFTAEEIAQWEIDKADLAERKAAEEAAIAARDALKASAKAKLVAGQPLTEEEAATIVL